MEFYFEPINFIKNLGYMGLGMLGIFVVIGLIAGVTVLLNDTTARIEKKRKK